MTRFYSKAVNNNNKKAANFKTKVSFDAETKILSYKVMQFHIYGVDRKKNYSYLRDLNLRDIPEKDKNPEIVFKSTFSTHELNALVSLLLMEIRKRYNKGSEKECNKNRCLYHRSFSAKKKNAPRDTNFEWLK